MRLRLWLRLAIVPVLVGCQDLAAPLNQDDVADPQFGVATWSTGVHILQQAPTAPPLETYQVSFWARKDKASTVIVNYRPVVEESTGQPFLRFHIPEGGLQTGPDRRRLARRDSVFITLTIDRNNFSVDFQPSGVGFSKRRPASLAIWYGNANQDLNGDGVVDATDQTLAEQLAFWVRNANPAPWLRTSSTTETGPQWVSSALFHFSEYAVSW